jgi:hypothetical protein
MSWNARVQLMNRPSNYHLFFHLCVVTFAVASGDRLQMPCLFGLLCLEYFFDGDESSIQCCVSKYTTVPLYAFQKGVLECYLIVA